MRLLKPVIACRIAGRGKGVGITAAEHAKENQAYLPHSGIQQRTPNSSTMHIDGARVTCVMENPLALLPGEPGGFPGTGRQVEQKDNAQHEGRQPFDQEQPLPAGKTGLPLQVEEGSCDRPHNTELMGKEM